MCNKSKKNKKKLSQFLKSHISGTRKAISLKFGMWSAGVGGSVHSKNRLVSSRQHRATELQKLHFFLPVNILTGVTRRLLGPHATLPCVLIPCFVFKLDCFECRPIQPFWFRASSFNWNILVNQV